MLWAIISSDRENNLPTSEAVSLMSISVGSPVSKSFLPVSEKNVSFPSINNNPVLETNTACNSSTGIALDNDEVKGMAREDIMLLYNNVFKPDETFSFPKTKFGKQSFLIIFQIFHG